MKTDKTKSLKERRIFPRHDVKLDVNYRHGDTYLFSETENLSELGIFLVADVPFDKGTRIELVFRPPEGGDPIEVEGEVIWIEKGGSGKKPGMGIRFLEPGPMIRTRIKSLIRTIAYLE